MLSLNARHMQKCPEALRSTARRMHTQNQPLRHKVYGLRSKAYGPHPPAMEHRRLSHACIIAVATTKLWTTHALAHAASRRSGTNGKCE